MILFSCARKVNNTDYKLLSMDIDNLGSIESLIDSISVTHIEIDDSLKVFEGFGRLYILEDGYLSFTKFDGRIFKFDVNGNYLFDIDRKGRGPGEYLNLSSIAIKDDRILAIDSPHTLLEYSIKDGSFIRSRKIDGYHGDMIEVIGDKIILFNRNMYYAPLLTNNINVYNYSDLELVNRLMPTPEIVQNLHVTIGMYFSKNNDKLYLSNNMDRNIYQITPNEAKVVYKMDYGDKYTLPDGSKEGRPGFMTKPYNYFISDDYAYFSLTSGKHSCLYDIKNDKLYPYSAREEMYIELRTIFELKDNCLYSSVGRYNFRNGDYKSLIKDQLEEYKNSDKEEPLIIKIYLKK